MSNETVDPYKPKKEDLWKGVPNKDLVKSFAGRLFEEAGTDRPEAFPEKVKNLMTPGLVKRLIARIPEMSREDVLATRETIITAISGIGSEGALSGDFVHDLFRIAEELGKAMAGSK